MGKEFDVGVELKIHLEDFSKIEQVKKEIGKVAHVNTIKEEDIGFGIKVLKVVILLKDSDGGMDKLEERIKGIENVTEVEVENMNRL